MTYRNATLQWEIWFDGTTYFILQPGESMTITDQHNLVDVFDSLAAAEVECFMTMCVEEAGLTGSFRAGVEELFAASA